VIGTQTSLVFFSALRVFLSLLLGTSALMKLVSASSFATTVRSYQILPEALAGLSATVLIVTEIALSAFLITGYQLRFALVGVAALILIFSIAIGINLLRHRTDLNCGCFGPAGTKIGWGLIFRNLFILCLVSAGMSIDLPSSERRLGLGVPEFLGSMGFVLFLLFGLLSNLVSMGSTRSFSR
jgi:uncharacterized membrane protein YphA (DoxX/SURF4 family)